MKSTLPRKKTVERSHQTATCEGLNNAHYQHFIDEGWKDTEIQQAIAWGVRSVSRDEAAALLGYRVGTGGIWFPFSAEWGQLRLDRPLPDGSKYLSTAGSITSAALWMPPRAELGTLAAITEGWKDAFIATIRGGQPVGAIAGVSHAAKALPAEAAVPLLFDSDGWQNANVMGALITGGQHLKGRIALIPQQYGAKAGCTEFFVNGGDRAGFAELLNSAQSPAGLLREWKQRLLDAPLELPKHCDDLSALHRKVERLNKAVGMPKKQFQGWQQLHIKAWRKAFEARLRAEQVLSLDAAPVGEFPALSLPPSGQRRLFALNGQKGTGKSSRALKALVDAARAAGLSVLYYVPTQMLSAEAAVKIGLTCHLDKLMAASSNYVMSCGESAHLFRDRRWDVVIVDEVNEVLPRSWQGILGQNPKAARAALAQQIAAAKIVAIAQDGLYRPVLNAVQRIGRFSAEQVEIISRRRPQSAGTITTYESTGGYFGWADILLSAAQQGQKLSIPSGSENELSILQRWLRQRCPDGLHKKLAGKAKSFSGDRKEFATGPDAYIQQQQPSTLGYSPVFNSGVSIEQPYFDAQFEYVATLETATAASQRGERVRAAIGGIPRHIYFQKRGLPALPPLEVFSADYWQSLLSTEDRQNQPDLKAIGMADAAKLLEREAAPIEQFPELAEVLAIQARELHFKQECLQAEWAFNGWQVLPGAIADEDTQAELSEQRREIREGILQSKGRSLALAPNGIKAEQRCPKTLAAFRAKLEAEGPITAVKFTRWAIEDRLGILPELDTPEFWAAYHLDSVGEISAAQINALLRIQFEQPELWAAMQRNAALRAICSHAVRDAAAEQAASGQQYGHDDLPAVPELAASPRLLTTAALLGKCPGIREAMAGELQRWDKNSEVVKAAHRWAIAHAPQLAALSKHGQRWFGLQFKKSTYAVQAFHKLLGMAGLNAQKAGQRDRAWQYRLQSAADVQRYVERAMQAGRNTARLLREQYRAEHQEQVITGALNQAIATHNKAADQWAALEAFTREHFNLCTEDQKEDSNTSEIVCSPPESPNISDSDWLDFADLLRQARLFGSSAVDEVREMLLPVIGGTNWQRLIRRDSCSI